MGGTEPGERRRVLERLGSVALVVLLCRALFLDAAFRRVGLGAVGIAFDLLLLAVIVASLVGRVRRDLGGGAPGRA